MNSDSETDKAAEAPDQQNPAPGAETQGDATAEAQLAVLKAEADRYKDLALRTQADFDNYRKRVARDTEDARKYANAALLERILPVVDNFELGLEAARKGGDPKAILDGMGMVLRQIQDFLNEAGVQTIDAAGSKFDPNLHDAVSQEPSETVPEGVVIRQLRKGYKLKDRLLRAAAVTTSKGAVKAPQEAGAEAR